MRGRCALRRSIQNTDEVVGRCPSPRKQTELWGELHVDITVDFRIRTEVSNQGTCVNVQSISSSLYENKEKLTVVFVFGVAIMAATPTKMFAAAFGRPHSARARQ